MGDGHHLHPDGARLRLSGRRGGLVQPAGTLLADLFNTDQGSQFTSAAFTGRLLDNAIAISMDGRGAWRDNVFVERLWRSVKYEEVYLRAYDSVAEARRSIGGYLAFYNHKRPHSSLDARTPDQVYFAGLPQAVAA
jgi:putative transposase